MLHTLPSVLTCSACDWSKKITTAKGIYIQVTLPASSKPGLCCATLLGLQASVVDLAYCTNFFHAFSE